MNFTFGFGFGFGTELACFLSLNFKELIIINKFYMNLKLTRIPFKIFLCKFNCASEPCFKSTKFV